jgi:hypothetical protein
MCQGKCIFFFSLLLSFFYCVWLYVITLEKQAQKDGLWRVAATSARSEIRGTEFGTNEMNEMCEKMGGILSARA